MKDRGQFTLLDYSFFVIVFVASAAIGLYYAVKSRKTTTTVDDYLLGGRKMGLFPVTCSLIATSITGATIVGQAAEAYAYGSHTWMNVFSLVLMCFVVPTVFLPIFSELRLTSSFKYFELRFSRRVRLLASGLFLFTGLIFLPITVYVPALTFQRVTGVNTFATVIILSLLCAFYTSIGGFKAVIWTDVVQLGLVIASCAIVATIGVGSVDGVENVFAAAKRGDRIIIFNTENLNSRSSVLGYILSDIFVVTYQFGINQTNLQRFLSLPNIRNMRISLWILVAVFSVFIFFSPFLGLVMYANYETCDPFRAGLIEKIDQILPYFIQERASLFLGFNGIFIAGIFSASLSTTSSYLNAMSGIIYEDFIVNRFPGIKEQRAGKFIKGTVFLLGLLQIGLVMFIEKMGSIVQMVSQCISLNASALLTLFILGALVPKANSTGAQFGALAGIISVLTFMIGSLNNKVEPMLPLRIDGCDAALNSSSNLFQIIENSSNSNINDEESWPFKLSFVYYGLIGSIPGIVVGYLVSLLTGGNVVEDQRLLAPFLRSPSQTLPDVLDDQNEARIKLNSSTDSLTYCD